MSDTPTPDTLMNARDVAEKARRAADDYQRAHQDSDFADEAVVKRSAELKRLAMEASSKLVSLERDVRAAAGTKRRAEKLADDASLQGRLRAEAQARREAPRAAPRSRRGLR